jgi:predicted urease superfamily metal-dependent hydrolase
MQYNKISETLIMFRSLVNNTDVYIDDIKNITTNIVNAINSYINNYYVTLVAYIGHNHIQAPSDVVLLPKPTVFTTTGENNDLD